MLGVCEVIQYVNNAVEHKSVFNVTNIKWRYININFMIK